MAFYPLGRWGSQLSMIGTRSPNFYRVTAQEIVMSGPNSVIRSQNYDGTKGWAAFGDGTATFFSISLSGGDIKSTNWDGGSDLSGGKDGAATAGYFADGSAGAAQFQTIYAEGGSITNLNITGNLTMTTGGVLRSAATGTRVEITNTAVGYGSEAYLSIYSAASSAAGSETYPFSISTVSGFVLPDVIWNHTVISAGSVLTNDTIPMIMLDSATSDGSYGGFVRFISGDIGTGGLTSVILSDLVFQQIDGTAAAPSYTFANNPNTGIFRQAANVIGFTVGGIEHWRIRTDWSYDPQATGAPALRHGAGTASTPTFTFTGDNNTGVYRYSKDSLGFALGGGGWWRMAKSGTQSRLYGAETNDYLGMDYSSEQWTMVINDLVELNLGQTGFLVPNVYNSTTGSAANVYVASGGRMYRSTSTEKWKSDIRPWAADGNILSVQPVTFYPMRGNDVKGEKMVRHGRRKLLGLTYENVKEHFPKGTTNDEALDWNAITTALLAEVQLLSARVAKLEDSSHLVTA